MKTLIKLLLLAVGLSVSASSFSNGLSISNTTLTGQDVSAGSNNAANYVKVQFDITWDNSFRDATNWDAAWIFIKYKVSSGNWQHATLSTSGHTAPSGSSISTPSDGKGIFVYRDASGTGTFSLSSVQLKWNYAADGVLDDDSYDIKVFGIEMVYVPEGSFYAGSGGSGTSEFTKTLINTADATTAPSGSSGSYSGGYPYGQTSPSYATWPNGYSAFYCMKYEISQGQITDFMNCLSTRTEQSKQVNTNITGTTYIRNYYPFSVHTSVLNRNYIECNSRPSTTTELLTFTCDAPEIAANHLKFNAVAAYLDWSALRLMTELEYEKACRGDQTPTANEYAWGSTSITSTAYSINNSATDSETLTASTTAGNAVYYTVGASALNGPMRCGAFATSSSSRVLAGASYYGIMELSGNLWERVVNISSTTGRAYTGSHGDGTLSSSSSYPGYATNSDWPGYTSSAGGVTTGTGSGYRGGSVAYSTDRIRVSDRYWISYTDYGNDKGRGGRGVRTAE